MLIDFFNMINNINGIIDEINIKKPISDKFLGEKFTKDFIKKPIPILCKPPIVDAANPINLESADFMASAVVNEKMIPIKTNSRESKKTKK